MDVDFAEEDGATRATVMHSGPLADDAPGESYRQGWSFVRPALQKAA